MDPTAPGDSFQPSGLEGPASRSCQVKGCGADLISEGQPSLKLKTCHQHRKASAILVDGVECRYCQQCVKLHELHEFDGEKRGCRKRLKDHNLRRKRNSIIKRIDGACMLLDESLQDELRAIGVGTRLKSGELRPEAIERINKLLQKPKKSKTDATAQPSSEQNCVSSYNDLPSAHGSTSKGEHSSPASQESIPHTANDLLDHRTENVSNPIDKGSASFDADQLSAFVSWPSQFQAVGSLDGLSSNRGTLSQHDLDILAALNSAVGLTTTAGLETFKEIGIAHPSSEVLRNVMGGDLGLTFNNSDELSPSFHMNMKIADATPHDLPDNLYDKLLQFHEGVVQDVAGTIRPGCVHLAVIFTMRSLDDYRASVDSFAANFASSIGSDDNMPWNSFDVDLILPASVVTVRNRGMAVSVSPRMGFPVIERVLPLAVTCGGNLAVRLSNIDLSIPLTVLCRAGDRQHILDINHQKQISAEHGILELGVMLPPLASGLAWLDVMQTGAEGFCMSHPVAMLITSNPEVAEEVSSLAAMQEHMPPAVREGILKDIGALLHGQDNVPAQHFYNSALQCCRLGWSAALQEVVDAGVSRGHDIRSILGAGDTSLPHALLRQAVLSSVAQTVKVVLAMMEEAGVTDLVHRADPSTGLTALHWAALYGQEEIITLLMTQCAGALDVWLHSRAGANQVRPQELWAIRHRPEQLAQSSLKHEERGGAAPGHGVLAQLALNLVESPVLIVGLVVLLALEGTWLCAVQEDAITWALLLMTSCLFFSAVCWTHYKAVRQDLETEFRAAGVNLSWSLQPLDKAFASAVYAYHTSRLTWVDHICSAINLGLPLTFPQQVALWNKKFVSPGMLSCQLTWLILGFTIRYYFAKRGNFKSLQWMNAVLDTSLYVFYAALSVCGLLSGSHLDTNLTGLQAVGSLGWLMVLNVTFATLVAIPQAIRTPFPMDSVLGIRFISQVLQTAWFMLTRASAQRTGRPVLPLGTCLGTWLVASILSSTLLIVLRLNVERSNGMKFMRHWTEMSKRM